LRIRSKLLSAAPLNREAVKKYVSLHAYHTTGIEGNTLTLPETILVVDGKELLAGFPNELLSPTSGVSVLEVRNIQQIFHTLGLGAVPSVSPARLPNIQSLVDVQAAITRDLKVPVGLRQHAVGIGHQRVILPMPDELDALMLQYFDWLAAEFSSLSPPESVLESQHLRHILALSCDAHTRLVFVHPFSDGNGRTARLWSGLILQPYGLPTPMFLREKRMEYISAVSAATIDKSYSAICRMHAEAVERSLIDLEALVFAS